MDVQKISIYIGTIIHCKEFGSLDVLENHFLAVQGNKIIVIDDIKELNNFKGKFNENLIEEYRLKSTQFIIPGLIDTHIHAVQYPNCGLGYDKSLLDWLESYTFPLEKKFKDTLYAKKVFDAVVRNTLKHGTTTACYFGSLYTDATLCLVDSVIKYGQRAFVGKVNMTRNAPSDYCETHDQIITETKRFIDNVLELNNDRVQPIFTPRFAISLDEANLKEIGDLVKYYDLHVQTHICENLNETEYVKELFQCDYANVYDAAGLLTTKTILAHGVHLQDHELRLLNEKKTSISHCPQSNTCLQSGMCDVRRLIEHGIEVGLGTDVSGGASTSIIAIMRDALTTSIHISFNKTNYVPLNYMEVFYLATLGGAKALSLDDKIGNFQIGKHFDALIVDIDVESGAFHCLEEEYSPMEMLQKFIFLGDDRNILSVIVDGKVLT